MTTQIAHKFNKTAQCFLPGFPKMAQTIVQLTDNCPCGRLGTASMQNQDGGEFVRLETLDLHKYAQRAPIAKASLIDQYLDDLVWIVGDFCGLLGQPYSKFMVKYGQKLRRIILLQFGLITSRFAYGRDRNS